MISLYGKLARTFEKKYRKCAKNINIKVKSAGEMVRAMNANFPGFKQLIKKSGYYRIVRGQAMTDGSAVTKDELSMNFSTNDWHIMPVATGCGGKGGILSAVLGVLIIVASIYFPPAAAAGYAVGGITIAQSTVIMFGMSLVLGGISAMLTPEAGDYSSRETDEKPSYLFNGPTNTVEPGISIPLVYGESFIGSIFVSGGLEVQDI